MYACIVTMCYKYDLKIGKHPNPYETREVLKSVLSCNVTYRYLIFSSKARRIIRFVLDNRSLIESLIS